MKSPVIFLLGAALVLLSTLGCRKESFDTSPSFRLQFSTDSVRFDTVFTKLSAATQFFKVKNTSSKAIKISHIRLAGGTGSPFRMNVDGRATTDYANYELAGGDSFYVFVEVTINPNGQNAFLVLDSILFDLNGNEQKIVLQAFGQDAHYFFAKKNPDALHSATDGRLFYPTISTDEAWNDDKPYFIYDNLVVNAKLTLNKGVKVYSRLGAIIVFGTLEVKGTKDEPVTFQGNRLEKIYEDDPGQWYGIILRQKSHAVITHAVIKNAAVGIATTVDTLPVQPVGDSIMLRIEKSTIKNMSAVGIYGDAAHISAKNLLVYSCGQAGFVGYGGTYHFSNCTFDNSNYDKGIRTTPTVYIANQSFLNTTGKAFSFPLDAQFRNCLISGSLDDEVKAERLSLSSLYNYVFEHNFIQYKDMHFNSTNSNTWPQYKSFGKGDYHLLPGSPAVDAGASYQPPFDVTDDMDDQVRSNKPDLGCYEVQ